MEQTLTHFRCTAEEKEQDVLFSKAAFSKEHHRYVSEEEDYRLPYKRDVDRIVHSKAYARYIDKTQVVYLVENDHISHRSLHVQLVSSFSRNIAAILHLNSDLVEAIALGHDVGHPPFGHEGERYLTALSEEHGNGSFAHPLQSCRLLTEIEPLNLGFAVYDGFLCHDGGMRETVLSPHDKKTWEDHFLEKEKKAADPNINLKPATLEGCLVKLCDTMSYLGRDVEDAISLGILSRDEVPKTCLGTTNREILNHIGSDIIKMSYGNDYIAISEEVYEALKVLRKFNFEHIYEHPKLKVESKKIERSYRILFETILDELQQKREESYIWKNYVYNKPKRYIETTSPVQMVVDFVSGMTDNFFVKTLENHIVPKRIELFTPQYS